MDYFWLLELLLLAKVFSRESGSHVCVSTVSVLLLAFLSLLSFLLYLLCFSVMFVLLVIVVFLEELSST